MAKCYQRQTAGDFHWFESMDISSIERTVKLYFVSAELRKIHRHFYYPHPGKLYTLMRRADPGSAA